MAETRVGVVGLGLIGGSLLRALATEFGPGTAGWDLDAGARDAALAAGLAIAEGGRQLARQCDVVFVAVPPDRAADTVLEVLAHGPLTVVSDVSSVKGVVVAEVLARAGDGGSRFVGGHPLAGDPQGGFLASRADLFDGATWALCPGVASVEAFAAVADSIERVGADALVVEPAEHDAAVAFSSHLPHLVAAVLASGPQSRPPEPLVAALSGGALRDATRVAAADPDLWLTILGANRSELADVLAAARDALAELAQAVENEDWRAVEDALRAGASGRARLMKTRWSPLVWEDADVPVASWQQRLLALGREGRRIRGVQPEGETLRFRVSAEPAV